MILIERVGAVGMVGISEGTAREISNWIGRRMEADGTPGLSLAICDRGGVVHTSAFGLADIAANRAMSTGRLFETGSIGKSFTAIALLQLADEGKVDLQAPVTDYLPWFSVQSAFEPIRLHHLLSHTAGITSGIDFAPDGAIQVWALRDSVATTPPGTYFHYSNLGYKVLGEVLRAVTGETYGPVIQGRILDPLGLRDSFPVVTHDIRDRLAVGYGALFDDRPWWPGRPLAPATWFETDTPDGCLAMTASDLVTYLRMLLNRGSADGTRVLSEQAFSRLTQRAIEMPGAPEPSWYGYGLVTREVRGHTYVGHAGGMVGYFSGMIGDLDSGLGVVALVNGPGSPNLIARQVLDFLRARSEGAPFQFPGIESPYTVANAANYAGDYIAVEGEHGPAHLSITMTGNGLSMRTGTVEGRPRRFGPDAFVTDAPGLDRFVWSFTPAGGESRELIYGDTRYRTGSTAGESTRDVPVEWRGFAGHYRSHNPWTPSFRVVAREGRLWLVLPSEPDGLEATQPLVPFGDGGFRCGEDERIPERIRFDAIVEGKSLRANLSGGDFYRVNMP